MKEYLVADIGGTLIKSCVMNEQYEVLIEEDCETKKNPAEFLSQLLELGQKYRSRIAGIAICMGGFIDPDTGKNSDYTVGENFRTYNLKKVLGEKLFLPVSIENDSNCAALGEMLYGAARDVQNFGLITVGTGVGGAIVIDGKLVRGSHFKAGEVGIVVPKGMQTIGATAALVEQVSALVGESVNGYYIFSHMDNLQIREIYHNWLQRLAFAVGNMAVLIDPPLMLIGGGISHQEQFICDLRNEVYQMFGHLEDYTQICACKLGNSAGKLGALSVFHEMMKEGM